MNKIYSFSKKTFALSVLAASLFKNDLSAQITTLTYTYTGAVQSFVVPACVTSATLAVSGAQGGSAALNGALGGSVNGVLAVTPGQTLYIYVGSQPTTTLGGFNGGGNGGVAVLNSGMGGGGASDIRVGGTALTNRIMVAGGGGGVGSLTTYNPTGGAGGGGNSCASPFGFGGGAGNGCITTPGTPGGCAGGAAPNYGTGGGGGGLNSGAPAAGAATGSFGGAGTLGVGGDGGGYMIGVLADGAGGGGGGYYGGAGGESGNGGCNGGGGGGSSYANNTALTNINFTGGNRSGHGIATITYNYTGPVITISASPTVICTASSSTLNANVGSSLTYTWNNGPINTTSLVVLPTVTTVYTLQGTDASNCTSSATMAVNVNTAVPSLSIASTATAVCSGKGVSYTASGALTYTWITGNTNNALATYTPALPGATYSVIGGNACGTSTMGVSVVTNTIPLVTASINTPTVCSGNTVTIIGGGAVTYTWAGGFPNNSPFAPSATTNYSVTGTSAQGCTATAVTAVTVYITPNVPPAVTPTAICVGQTATLSATGATSYSWIPGVNLVTQSVVVSPAAPTTYTLYRDNSGCTSTANISLVVNALPIMSASGTPSNICAGQGANLVVVGPITNTWFPGPFTQSNFTVFPNSSRDYTVVGSNANCTISAVVSISVNPTPTLTVAYTSPTLCSGGTNNLTANGAITYTWMNGTNNLGNNQTISVSPPVTAQYILMGTNASGCTATVNPLVVVYALPNSNIVSSAPFICAGAPAILGVTVTPGSTFSWNTGAITPSITVSPTVTTNYNLTVTTSSTGCQSSSVFPLSVYIATYAITSPTAVCKGNTATITAVGAASNYTWMTGSTTVGTTSVISVSPQVTTVYNVTGSTGGCIYTRTVNLIVNPIPPVRATPDKNPMCYLDPVTIVASGANSYSWSTTSTLTAIDVSQQNITTTYTLTGTDLNGCSKTVTVTQYVATCTGIENYSSNNIAISVYPNPSNGNFFISSDVALDLSVVNTLGQEVSRFKADLNRKEIQLNNLPGGIYFITGQANGIKVNKKIIIDK